MYHYYPQTIIRQNTIFMHIKKLHIRNFRCFSDYEIEFASGVTVLFGKNGSGKTTLIHALHKALSFMMHSEKIKAKDPKTKKFKPIGEKSIRSNNPYVSVEGFSLMGDTAEGDSDYLLELFATAELDKQTPLEWAISAYSSNCRLRPSEYKSAFETLYDWHLASNELPLLAYYSDGFPHVVPYTLTNKKEVSREASHVKCNYAELGYTEWNSEKGFTNTWIERLKSKLHCVSDIPSEIEQLEENYKEGRVTQDNYKLLLEQYNFELQTAKQEINAITACIRKFFEGDSFYEFVNFGLGRYRRSELYYLTSSGQRGALRELPAGYKRLAYIVLDIAYRSYLLSGMTTTNISGIAIIDEIDLHLHPELEQVVLQRFQKTFPQVQFIISTHSPLVLSNFDQSVTPCKFALVNLLKKDGEYSNRTVQNIYGIDYNSSVTDVMGTSPNPRYADKLAQAYEYWVSKDKEKAARIADMLREKYGVENAIIKNLGL